MKFPHRLMGLVCRAAATLFTSALLGCATAPPPTADGRVYHCIGGAVPVPPPDTWGKKYTTESFSYAEYKIDESTIARGIFGHSRCGEYSVPKFAYLRYQVDGRVLEKHFDLSALTAWRVRGKTILFFADGDMVEVRLMTPVQGALPSKEVIDRR
jgi:hypothetical protein